MPSAIDELAVSRRNEHIEVSVVVGCQWQGHRSVAGISPQGWFDCLGQRITASDLRDPRNVPYGCPGSIDELSVAQAATVCVDLRHGIVVARYLYLGVIVGGLRSHIEPFAIRERETGQRITSPCKAIESSRFGWSCVSTSDSHSSGAQAVSPNDPEPPSIRGRCRSTRTVRKSSRSEYSRSGCCRRQHLLDDRSSRLSLMAILSSMPLGTANHSAEIARQLVHTSLTNDLTHTVFPQLGI